MANALPHAIGAQLAYPGRQVISMSGDGGLGMLPGELLTVAMHDLPVKIVVFNNARRYAEKLRLDAVLLLARLRRRTHAERVAEDRERRRKRRRGHAEPLHQRPAPPGRP
jgi:hypothetical protein